MFLHEEIVDFAASPTQDEATTKDQDILALQRELQQLQKEVLAMGEQLRKVVNHLIKGKTVATQMQDIKPDIKPVLQRGSNQQGSSSLHVIEYNSNTQTIQSYTREVREGTSVEVRNGGCEELHRV